MLCRLVCGLYSRLSKGESADGFCLRTWVMLFNRTPRFLNLSICGTHYSHRFKQSLSILLSVHNSWVTNSWPVNGSVSHFCTYSNLTFESSNTMKVIDWEMSFVKPITNTTWRMGMNTSCSDMDDEVVKCKNLVQETFALTIKCWRCLRPFQIVGFLELLKVNHECSKCLIKW